MSNKSVNEYISKQKTFKLEDLIENCMQRNRTILKISCIISLVVCYAF